MELLLWPVFFFDRKSDADREAQLDQQPSDIAEPERRIVCARCGYDVTKTEHRFSVNGAVEHDFSNPLGIQFHIACFREAPGCAAIGEGTMEHTWFAGYEWRIGVCRECGVHLGWLFTSPSDAFYGLIVDRLVDASR